MSKRPKESALQRLLTSGSDDEVVRGRATLRARGAWTAERAEEAVAALGRLRDPEARLLVVERIMDAPELIAPARQRELLELARCAADRRLLRRVLGKFELDASDALVRWMIDEDLVRDHVEELRHQLDRSPVSASTLHALLALVPGSLPLKEAALLVSHQVWRWRDRLALRLLVRCALGAETVAQEVELRQGLFLTLSAIAIDLRKSGACELFALDRPSGYSYFSHLDAMLDRVAALLEAEPLMAHRGTQLWLKDTLAASDPALHEVAEFPLARSRERLLQALARLLERPDLDPGLREQVTLRLTQWSRA